MVALAQETEQYVLDTIARLQKTYKRYSARPEDRIGAGAINDIRKVLARCLFADFEKGLSKVAHDSAQEILQLRISALGLMGIVFKYAIDQRSLGEAPDEIIEQSDELYRRLTNLLAAFQGKRTKGIYAQIMAPSEIKYTLKELQRFEKKSQKYFNKYNSTNINLIITVFNRLFVKSVF